MNINNSRLTGVANLNSGTQTISSNYYVLDGVGNRLSNATQRGTDSYSYDAKYQLTSATHPTLPAETYTYDAAGNRTIGLGYNNWSYNVNNQLTGFNGVTYAYDNNGNVTSATDAGGTTHYYYDYENRLVQVNFAGGGSATYKYDGQGRRIEKNINGVITRYLYNGSDMIAEYDGSGVLQAKWVHGSGLGEPLAMQRGANVYWYHGDGLGSVTEVTDGTEALVEQYLYDSFGNMDVYDGSGNPLTQTAIGNPFAYIGREYDYESGLYYLRARYYSPEQGRFLMRDPIQDLTVPSPFIPMNLYMYASNNPTLRKDPSGLFAFPCFLAQGIYMSHSTPIDTTKFGYPSRLYEWEAQPLLPTWACADCCKFIQEMTGSLIELDTHIPILSSEIYWGGTPQLMNFDVWVVDSYTMYAAYGAQVYRGTEDRIYMSDEPMFGVGKNPRRSTITFRTAVYTNSGQTVNPFTGQIIGDDDPVSGPEYWYFHWETDASGALDWKSP
jgi:RHS repeat-associated protein